MGGIGSGNRGSRGGSITANMDALDVRQLARDGYLEKGQAGYVVWSRRGIETGRIGHHSEGDRLRLLYQTRTRGGEWQTMDYRVQLDRTSCHLGGMRTWFLCPMQGCGRRVAILYGGKVFACRGCHQLTYESQRLTAGHRADAMARRVRKRLGWSGGVIDGLRWTKPRGMHWSTYEKLVARHRDLERRAVAGWVTELANMGIHLRAGVHPDERVEPD